MKKILSILLILTGMLAFASCGGDDDDNTKSIYTKSQVIGKWNATDLKSTGTDWKNIEALGTDYMWLKLNADGSYQSKEFGDKGYTGTWALSGKFIKCKSNNVGINYEIISLTGNKVHLKMSFDDEDGAIEMKATKE